jgi:hypothetical protein
LGPLLETRPGGGRLSCNLGRANAFDATAPPRVSLGGNKPGGVGAVQRNAKRKHLPLGHEGVLADSEIPQAHQD